MTSQELKQLLLILIIFIAACVETDIYLPAFPDMMAAFQVSETQIQKLLSWNFVGLCLSGPVYGPFSDSFGRKRPLLVALLLFLVGSLMTVSAQQFEMMLWGRFLQGLGSGGCFTLGTAIIFDAFEEKRALYAINKLNVTVPLIMAGAPLLGGYLNYTYGFRSNFWTITCLVLLSLLVTSVSFRETLAADQRTPLRPKTIVADFIRVLKSVTFWQLTAVVSLLWAGYLAFLSITSVLFMVNFGVSKAIFPLFQAALLVAYVTASLLCDGLIRKRGILFVKKAGVLSVLTGGTLLGGVALLAPENPYWLTIAMLPYAFGASWTQTPYFGEIMAIFPSMKGIVASLLTSIRLFLAVGFLGLINHAYNGTIYPVTLGIVGICTFILPTILTHERRALNISVVS